MSNNKSKVAIVDFTNNLIDNFGNLIFTNLIFAIPFAILFAIFYFIDSIINLNLHFILMLFIIPLFPFFAGVTLVCTNIVKETKNLQVFSTFVKGVKENFKAFLLHGVVLYFVSLICYYSIYIYSKSISQLNGSGAGILPALYVFLVISSIIAIVFLFMFYYIPAMTVTFNMNLKVIYKNSALMSFGELKNNIIATLGIVVFLALSSTILLFIGNINDKAIAITSIIILLFFAPSLVSFIINSAIYRGMFAIITQKDEQTKIIEKKIKNRKNGQINDDNIFENLEKAKEFADLEVDENKDGDEYIFYNGKMVKRSVIVKIKKELAEQQED